MLPPVEKFAHEQIDAGPLVEFALVMHGCSDFDLVADARGDIDRPRSLAGAVATRHPGAALFAEEHVTDLESK